MKTWFKLTLFVLLVQLPMAAYDVGTPFDWGPPSVASAQVSNSAAQDPCLLFPHKSVYISGTSTAKLITGPNAANGQIFICGVHLNNNASTSSYVLFAGIPNTGGTPCATSTASENSGGAINILNETLPLTASSENIGYSNTTLFNPVPPVPYASSTALYQEYDVCGYGAGTGTTGNISYVIVP